MKKMILLALVLLVSAAMVFASVTVNADELALGDVSSASPLKGLTLNGEATVELSPEGTGYAQMLTLPSTSSISFDAKAGESLDLFALVPEDGSSLDLELTGPDGKEVIASSSSEESTVKILTNLPTDGTYTLAPLGGSASLFSITVE